MARFILIIFIAAFSGSLFPQEQEFKELPEYTMEDSMNDSIFSSAYTDEEFKRAVFQTIQKNSLTNSKLFLKTLHEVKQGKVEKKDREYGVKNISKEFSEGLNGWTITLSGMLVVFVGLILILITIHIFNFFFKEKSEISVPKVHSEPETKPAVSAEDIPEDHVIAIATAVELYKRLYLVNSMTSLTFKSTGNSAWKAVDKFGLR
ncbi:TPA: hypothetical protein DCR49_00325 [Candidatus Delongbacteria bacterium]|nr:MAG: hypothetical protein A2Y39_05300 [Candidatus Delongbacteria bacterium GWF2_40_14]HAQ60443.1 hypothetical protein [Candidatus Delongbacteria bacterium]